MTAFTDAGRSPGLQIWRIENFEPVPVPQKEHGKFHEGDSYIVLWTYAKNSSGGLGWDIHFWLGKNTTKDESGAAARLTVDLDDSLGGGPVQHREVQGYESSQFLEYFKSGVRYLPGGVASGFHHVGINAPGEKKLYHVKGKRHVRVHLVEPSVTSMNKGDCFILDNGQDLFVYFGPLSKDVERLKASTVANHIRDQDHGGRAKVTIIDPSSTSDDTEEFFTQLGSGSESELPDNSSTDDVEFEKEIEKSAVLYKVSDGDGKLTVQKIGEKPLSRSMLKSEDCFILDTGASGIYVWVGRSSTSQEKVEAFKKGEDFLHMHNYPHWTKMKRIVQAAEPTSFSEYFNDWDN